MVSDNLSVCLLQTFTPIISGLAKQRQCFQAGVKILAQKKLLRPAPFTGGYVLHISIKVTLLAISD